jgi:hypothetical protein
MIENCTYASSEVMTRLGVVSMVHVACGAALAAAMRSPAGVRSVDRQAVHNNTHAAKCV